MKILSRSQMADLDRQTIDQFGVSERTLIARAGKAAAQKIQELYSSDEWRVLVLMGKGNNGADALVVAQHLKRAGYKVSLVRVFEADVLKKVKQFVEMVADGNEQMLVVDGIFGTGLQRDVREPIRSLINLINATASSIVALDVPSGLQSDDGRVMGTSFRADHTLTFGLPKMGLVQEHAAHQVGKLHVLDIGFPTELVEAIKTDWELVDAMDLGMFFQKRLAQSHKGSFGHVLVIGGSLGFAGAPALAARSALRTGAGLVTLVVPDAIYHVAAMHAGAEVMTHSCGSEFQERSISELKPLLERADAIVLGPGLGTGEGALAFIREILKSELPMVVDADALNLLARDPSLLNEHAGKKIFTPHPGEMARLMRMNVEDVQKHRFEVAHGFATDHQVTVVLKGARTVIAYPEPVHRFHGAVNAMTGNPGMATGGVGDVLSGILGALLARKLSESDAARAGVFLHGLAGDLAMPPTGGGIAGDLIEAIPDAMGILGDG